MQYMLLIYSAEDAWDGLSDDARNAMYAEYGAFSQALRDAGAHIAGDELQPTSAATTVSVRDGETIVHDGPFSETKESLGGYYLIDVESPEEAAAWAARVPSARHGSIEVRPVVMRSAPVGA